MIKTNLKKLIVNKGEYHSTLLREVSFELCKNNIYSIVGKNGTGKSTLIKALTGLLDTRFYTIDGEVFYDNVNLLNIDSEQLRKIRKTGIKYVFQDARNCFDPLKKLSYYFKNTTSNELEVNELLQYFLLPKASELFKLRSYELSGGMAQRISLILALLAHPALIILDEPTSGIDSAIANLFLLKLKEYVITNPSAILVVTQDITFAEKISDKIALLTNHTLTEFFPPSIFFEYHKNAGLDDLIQSYIKLEK
ncbi:MAG: ABC transporter ATP-binding protein [Ignavibacteriaceae bacterium]|nr:ABC transporter ATP-binding protein [Ignavibacteriaceae bacterium]